MSARVHLRHYNGRKMAAIDIPHRIGAIRVSCVGDAFADALGNAAQLALKLADDPVISAILPPGAGVALKAVKALSSAAQQGQPALQREMDKQTGPGAQRVAKALNKEAASKGDDAKLSTTGYYGLPVAGRDGLQVGIDVAPNYAIPGNRKHKGKRNLAQFKQTKGTFTFHKEDLPGYDPNLFPDADGSQDNDPNAPQYDPNDPYAAQYAQQGAQQYQPQGTSVPYANPQEQAEIDAYYAQEQAAESALNESAGLELSDDAEPPDYAEQEFALALDDASHHGDPHARRAVERARREHNRMMNAAFMDNDAAATSCEEDSEHEPYDHEHTSPQSLPNATRQPE